MSKTFTSRPANVSQRGGRGRGRTPAGAEMAVLAGTSISPSRAAAVSPSHGAAAASTRNRGGGAVSRGRGNAGRGQRTDPGLRGAVGRKDATQSRSTLQERTTHAEGFTVIRPDEKRRLQVAQQAERESKQYEQYKKQNKPSSFAYVGTAGGGEGVSLTEARQQQIRNQAAYSKTSRLLRDQDRRSQQRQEENRALCDRKEAARKLTSVNTRRQNSKQANWKSEMNRVNQAFLDRLEAQSKPDGPSSEQR